MEEKKSIFTKIKDWAYEKTWIKIPGINKKDSEPKPEMTQPKGDLVGQCALCSLAICSEDRYTKIPTGNGAIAHKRCVKKAQKATLYGQNPQTVDFTQHTKEVNNGTQES